jgi:hypothetical protein
MVAPAIVSHRTKDFQCTTLGIPCLESTTTGPATPHLVKPRTTASTPPYPGLGPPTTIYSA